MLSDQKIIAALKANNDDKVLNELYLKVKPKVTAYIRSNSGSLEEAEDIFQDAIVAFYRQVKLNRFNESQEIGGFIFAVSRNLWINKAKRDKRIIPLDSGNDQYTDHGNLLQDLITEERSSFIGSMIKALGENCEKILSMAYYQKRSLKEIASTLGYSNEGAVKTRNYKCKQRLMKLMKEHNLSEKSI